MLDFIWNKFFPDDNSEEFEEWVEEVANKITEIINEHEYRSELTEAFLNNGLGTHFTNYDRTLYDIWCNDRDTEQAAYKILKIIKDNEIS